MAVEVLSAVAAQGRRTAFAYLVGIDGGSPEPWDYDEVPELENIARAVQAALGITNISSADPVAVLVSQLGGDSEQDPRGDGSPDLVATPDWPSSDHRITVTFPDYSTA